MILTCPSCATRYSVDAATFPATGRQVRCAKCGESWFQAAPTPEAPPPEPEIFAPEPTPEPVAEPVFVPPPPEPVRDPTPELFTRPRAYSPPQPQEPRLSVPAMLGVAAGWAALIAVVLLIGLSAVRYRQEITVIWPQSAGVYSSLGMNVNAHGVDFTHVDYHRESEDGQVVLAVTGAIVNNGDRELPVPQIVRVTLSDAGNHEIYHWNFTPSGKDGKPIQTLKPKQSIPFLTRLSSPPAAARHLEVRFVHDDK